MTTPPPTAGIVEQWGLGPNAAEAVDQAKTVKSERARTKEIHQWWQGLDDGLTYAQVRAEAEQRWGDDVGAAVLADDYQRRQTRRATAWVRSRQAGFPPELVATEALKRFRVGNDPQGRLAAEYQAVAEQRTQKASAWLGLNDDWDTTETDQAATIAGFGLRPRYAEWLVANHRLAAIKAWVNNNLADDLPTHQAHQRITEQWGTRPLRRPGPSRMGTHPTRTPTGTAGTAATRPRQRRPQPLTP